MVFVEGKSESSGVTEQRIAQGRDKPVAWSPASSLWGKLLNYEADDELVPDENPSIVRTPLVIAMWEPMAKALGYPGKPLGFDDISKLARSKAGWADYGLPEYGAFKLVHTNPDESTSGLSAVVAEYYAATGKKEGLRPEDITGKAREQVRAIERSIVHYGNNTLFISDQMRKGGLGYASAVAMEEATLLEFNRTSGAASCPSSWRSIRRRARSSPTARSSCSRGTGSRRSCARARRPSSASWRRRSRPRSPRKVGFRPADLDAKPVAPITAANGVDPAQPERELELPEPRVLALLKRPGARTASPPTCCSCSTRRARWGTSRASTTPSRASSVFLSQAAPQDRVGLTMFSDVITPLVPIGPFRENKAKLKQTISRLIAEGGTAFYDATAEGYNTVRDVAGRNDRINAVVLLTDGNDTDSTRTRESVVQELEGQGDSSTQVRVFTIAYSAGAAGARQALEEIAAASGGNSYPGDPENIETVYRSISSFF